MRHFYLGLLIHVQWLSHGKLGFDCHFLLISEFLASIQALLSAPNPDDPLSEDIAKHWKSNESDATVTGKEGFS